MVVYRPVHPTDGELAKVSKTLLSNVPVPCCWAVGVCVNIEFSVSEPKPRRWKCWRLGS